MNPELMTDAEIVAELIAENDTPLSEQELAIAYQLEEAAIRSGYER